VVPSAFAILMISSSLVGTSTCRDQSLILLHFFQFTIASPCLSPYVCAPLLCHRRKQSKITPQGLQWVAAERSQGFAYRGIEPSSA
jgi:hypothetical protein